MKYEISDNRRRLTILVDDEERNELRGRGIDGEEIQSDRAMVDFLEPITCNSELQRKGGFYFLTRERAKDEQTMKRIRPSKNKERWPRCATKSVECRGRDLVVRISNWLSDKDEPALDVECYIGGVYDWNESKSFTLSSGLTRAGAKAATIDYANNQVAKLL